MIVQSRGPELRLITQNDHAHLAHQLIRLWPELADHARRDLILKAVLEHDRGWRGVDSSPVLNEDGRPCDFRALPFALRREVWRRGLETSGNGPADRWCDLLIAHHAWIIHRPDRRLLEATGRPGSDHLEFLAELEALRTQRADQFLESLDDPEGGVPLGLDGLTGASLESVLAEDYRWLRAADFLSLVACNQWAEWHAAPDPTSRRGDEQLQVRGVRDGLSVRPYPLRGSYSLEVRYRDIANTSYQSAARLGLELARAPWQHGCLRVAAGD